MAGGRETEEDKEELRGGGLEAISPGVRSVGRARVCVIREGVNGDDETRRVAENGGGSRGVNSGASALRADAPVICRPSERVERLSVIYSYCECEVLASSASDWSHG